MIIDEFPDDHMQHWIPIGIQDCRVGICEFVEEGKEERDDFGGGKNRSYEVGFEEEREWHYGEGWKLGGWRSPEVRGRGGCVWKPILSRDS